MALALNLSVVERNDSKLITFTDTSTGWGTEGDPAINALAARTSLTNSIIMNITINTPSEVIVCDQIDLYDLAGPFAVQADLVFELDSTVVLSSGVGISSNDVLPDGVWDISYKVQTWSGAAWVDVDEYSFSVLIYGDIKTQVYNRLRLIPNLYNSKLLMARDIQEPLLYYTFLQSVEKSAFVARKEELLAMLGTLERLLLNGSNYPW
jgi:hypothetical protein